MIIKPARHLRFASKEGFSLEEYARSACAVPLTLPRLVIPTFEGTDNAIYRFVDRWIQGKSPALRPIALEVLQQFMADMRGKTVSATQTTIPLNVISPLRPAAPVVRCKELGNSLASGSRVLAFRDVATTPSEPTA